MLNTIKTITGIVSILVLLKVLLYSKGPEIVGDWQCTTVNNLGEKGSVWETFQDNGKGNSRGPTLGISPISRQFIQQQRVGFDNFTSTWSWSMDGSVLTISKLKYDVKFRSSQEAKSFIEEKIANLEKSQYVADVEFSDEYVMTLREPRFGTTVDCFKEVDYQRLW